MLKEVAKDPSRVDLDRELGNAQADAGEYDAAIQTFQAVLPKVTDSKSRGDLLGRIGQAYRMKHDTEHSIEALEGASKEIPNNPAILTNLAELYSEEANYQKSRQDYESALKVEPNNPVALNNLAYLLADTNGDLDLALTYATRATQRMPDHPEVSDTLGYIYLKKKLTDSALDTFRRLVEQSPGNATYHYHYAIALSAKGDRNTARQQCETSAERQTERQTGAGDSAFHAAVELVIGPASRAASPARSRFRALLLRRARGFGPDIEERPHFYGAEDEAALIMIGLDAVIDARLGEDGLQPFGVRQAFRNKDKMGVAALKPGGVSFHGLVLMKFEINRLSPQLS